MSGGFFRGTSADQDTRFSNKQAKLLKSQKFAPELEHLVDITKVKMDVIKPWIATRVTELLGFEDEVLINFIYGLLEGKDVNGKEIQISLTGFMEKNTGKFMKELWTHLLSAQSNATGLPQQFLDEKEEEIRRQKDEARKREDEDRELKDRLKKMDEEVYNSKATEVASEPFSKQLTQRTLSAGLDDRRDTVEKNGSRGDDSVRRRSRSRSGSPSQQGRSESSERVQHSPRKRSITPRRRLSSRGSVSPSRRRSSYTRRRSRSGSQCGSPSPVRRRNRSPYRRRSPSPMRRRTPLRLRSPSPVRRRSPSPVRRRPRSPPRRRSPSPLRRRSPLPPRRRLRSPIQRRSMSPSSPSRRSRLPSLRRRRSPSPRLRKYISPRRRSPIRRRSPSPVRRRSPSPVRRRSPSPPRRGSPSPVYRRSPSPRDSPFPAHRGSPSPVRCGSLSPRDSTSPVQRRSPSPALRRRRRSPSTPRRRSYSPVGHRFSISIRRGAASRSRSRSPYGSKSPSRSQSPLPVRRRSAERQLRSSVQTSRGRITENKKLSPAAESLTVRPPSSMRSPQRDLKGRNNSPSKAPSSSSSPGNSPTLSKSPPVRMKRIATEDQREYNDKKHKSLQKRSIHPSSTEKEKDSPLDASNMEVHPSEDSVDRRDNESLIHPDALKLRKKDQEMRGAKISGIAVQSEVSNQQKSPSSMLDERQNVLYSGVGKGAEEKNGSHSNSLKYSDQHQNSETVPKSVKKSDHSYHSGSFDSGPDNGSKHKNDKEGRKHKRSSRHKVTSVDDYSSDSHTKDKEAKRKRKEEKRLRKEKKRRRHEEKRHKKEERRAEKLKAKSRDAVSSPSDAEKNQNEPYTSDGEHAVKRESQLSETEEAERLEIELRNKALESLKAKKGIRH